MFTGFRLQMVGFLLVSKVCFKPREKWQRFSHVKDDWIVHISDCSVTISLAGMIR